MHAPERPNDPTRRAFVLGGLSLAGLVLAGCGDDGTASSATSTADGSAAGGVTTAPTTTAPATRVIDTDKGKVTVPGSPKRIVCIANYPMGTLFDIGVTPVGVPDGFADDVLPQYTAIYAAAGKVGGFDEINMEQVAALRPDLILGVNGDFITPDYDQLTKLAPTVLLPLTETSDWVDLATGFAAAVGKSDELAAVKKRYEDRAKSISSNYSAALSRTKWTIISGVNGQWVLWLPDSSGGQVLTAAGVKFASASAAKTGNYAMQSFERTDLLTDADVVLANASAKNKPTAGTQAYLDQAAFKALKAAQAKHVYPTTQLFPLSYGEAVALLDQVETILKAQ